MADFNQFNLTPELQKAISELGFVTPTPVQESVIPVLLEGRRNMVALAQTGTGKTAAFGIPVLQRIDISQNTVQTLILCPTRELCLQVCRDIKSFAKHTKGVRTVSVYGGASIDAQLKALRTGVHIIVATPGRLHDILRRKRVDLSTASCVVLDEADEMLSMGFEEDLNAIMAAIPDNVQKLLFSATMPKQVASLTKTYMTDAVEITIGNRNAGAENVIHECYMVHEKDRYLALKRVVDSCPHIYGLIFCRTRIETQDTAAMLMKDGYSADALHGDLSQAQRDRVMESFRDRSLRMLVATDVAARGIDVSDLTHVINYQLPDDLESYTHRSGRTGRAGKSGVSAVLINMREKWKIQLIEKRIGKRFTFKSVPSGRSVCEAQLYQMIERAKDVVVDDQQIDPYLPEILKMLDGMPRETIIKHFVSLEFNRFLEYYRDAPDLSVTEAPNRERLSGDRVSLIVNAGKVDNFTATLLMGFLNRGARGNAIRIGKVDVKQKVSFFDVSPADADNAINLVNDQIINGRKLRVEPVRKTSAQGQDSRPRPVHPPKAGTAPAQRAARQDKLNKPHTPHAPIPPKRKIQDPNTPAWVREIKKNKK